MDLIDEILDDWHRERPEIDISGKAVACRLLRCHTFFIAALEKSLAPLGISPNMFSVLVTIRRKGRNAEITAKKIMEEALVTSGATSNLINKLISMRLITKRKAKGKEDSRFVFIKLTPEGRELIDRAMLIQAACERKVTARLSKAENEQLSTLLKKVQQEEVYSYADD